MEHIEIRNRLKKEWDENPIVEDLGLEEPTKTTNIEHIKELQEILVQTCIDYISKNKLTDIYSVSFYADDLNTSAEEGKWVSATDSSIHIKGLASHNYKKKNGEIFTIDESYDIGSYM